jgi:protein-tyrosine phosphatase
MDDPRRRLSLPALLNARDLGGYPARDGATTRWRSLLRSDDLVQLTPDGVRALGELGVASVVDLRWDEEVAASPGPLSGQRQISYRQISLLRRTEAEWRALGVDGTKEAFKCRVLDHARTELREVLGTIAAAPSGPLLFHCVAGKDRTGIIAALMLAIADVVPEAIAFDYAASTQCLREGYLQRYAGADPAHILEEVRCPEEGVYRMLEHLERLGGIRAYLETIGLSTREIEQLRARLRA